ncbi:hypothetical protein [Oceanobacillus sp. J11TS1]|nr:hypothetical protein [Oceanobacillus sp. J11TS1]GIO23438.1 hypothetical protein J11TS1_20190 [Oceanobacillus sp. J11TS1]
MLVDVDLRKPIIHYTFQLDNFLELSSNLVEETSLEEAVGSSDITN